MDSDKVNPLRRAHSAVTVNELAIENLRNSAENPAEDVVYWKLLENLQIAAAEVLDNDTDADQQMIRKIGDWMIIFALAVMGNESITNRADLNSSLQKVNEYQNAKVRVHEPPIDQRISKIEARSRALVAVYEAVHYDDKNRYNRQELLDLIHRDERFNNDDRRFLDLLSKLLQNAVGAQGTVGSTRNIHRIEQYDGENLAERILQKELSDRYRARRLADQRMIDRAALASTASNIPERIMYSRRRVQQTTDLPSTCASHTSRQSCPTTECTFYAGKCRSHSDAVKRFKQIDGQYTARLSKVSSSPRDWTKPHPQHPDDVPDDVWQEEYPEFLQDPSDDNFDPTCAHHTTKQTCPTNTCTFYDRKCRSHDNAVKRFKKLHNIPDYSIGPEEQYSFVRRMAAVDKLRPVLVASWHLSRTLINSYYSYPHYLLRLLRMLVPMYFSAPTMILIRLIFAIIHELLA